MKILVNTASLRSGGGLQVALSLLHEFARETNHEFRILLSPQLALLVAEKHFPQHIELHNLKVNPAVSFKGMRQFRKLALAIEEDFQPDAVLTVFGPAWWRPRAPHLVGFANGLFLFNKSHFIRNLWPKSTLGRLRYAFAQRLVMRQLGKEGTAFWVETETAASALKQVLPGKPVHVVGNAPSRSLAENVLTAANPSAKFRLLTICAAHPNKNLEIIRPLLSLMKLEDVEFLVTLPDADIDRIFPSNAARPRNLGVVHPEALADAYAQCDAVFLPSWLEIFSASYPEAMVMRKPILASDLPFAHEICGDAALYFNPADPVSAAAAIRTLMSDKALQEHLIEAGIERLATFSTAAERVEKLLCILSELATTDTALP